MQLPWTPFVGGLVMDCRIYGTIGKTILFYYIMCNLDVADRSSASKLAAAFDQQMHCRTDGTNLNPEKKSFLWSFDKTSDEEIRTSTKKNILERVPHRRAFRTKSYFFGTIHVPYTKVWDYVSASTKQAFEESDHVIFELDLTNSKTVRALSSCQLLPDGHELSDVIPNDLYDRLKKHLDYIEKMISVWITPGRKGRSAHARYIFDAVTKNWRRKRPVWILLMINSLTEKDVKSRGVPVLDLYLAQEAARLQKLTGAVERVEEQCAPLNSMNLSQVIFALNHSLRQHELLRTGNLTDSSASSADDLIFHYNCGDLDSVIFKRDSTQVAPVTWENQDVESEAIEEYFRVELIQKRNRRMAKRVIELLEAYPKRKFFFAFGAGHFLGNNSVIAFMKEMGYDITHLPANHQIKSSRNTGRRKNRQRSSVRQPDGAIPAGVHISQLEYWESNDQFLRDTDKLIANLRSDYVDERGSGRQQKRKPSRFGANPFRPFRRKTTHEPGENFNELWIAETTDASTTLALSTANEASANDMTHGRTKVFVWTNGASGRLGTITDFLPKIAIYFSFALCGLGRFI